MGRFRLAHECRLPDALTDLVPQHLPAAPLDPFDGEPLRYRKLAKGLVVYSVRPDLHDDEGKERPDKGQKNYDRTFSVER